MAEAAGPTWPITDYPRYWLFGEGFYSLSVDSTYTYSTQNYNQNGDANRPTTMSNIQFTNARAHVGVGVAPALSLFAQASLSSSVTSNAKYSGIPDGRNIGAGDGFFSARYLLFRSASANQEVPTDWTPNSFVLLLEPSWTFPLYEGPEKFDPARGDQSNDFSATLKFAGFLSHWFVASAGVGYTYRTAGYAGEIPFLLRGDITTSFRPFIRGWMEWKGNKSRHNDRLKLAPGSTNADAIPGGSLLFKGINSEQQQIGGGIGVLLSRDWEASSAFYKTISGTNSALASLFSLGLAYRPYQAVERNAEPPQEFIEKSQTEPKKKTKTSLYAYAVPVQEVSVKGNFVKIGRGKNQNVSVGEHFHLFGPEKEQGKEKAAALLTVVSVSPNQSYLKVEEIFLADPKDLKINTEFEARRIIDE